MIYLGKILMISHRDNCIAGHIRKLSAKAETDNVYKVAH